jgi:hypothetical protein
MKKKKKSESIDGFIMRRQKETGKVKITGDKVSPDMSGGSHKMKARQMMIGTTKPKTIKKMEKSAKKSKKKALEQLYAAT